MAVWDFTRDFRFAQTFAERILANACKIDLEEQSYQRKAQSLIAIRAEPWCMTRDDLCDRAATKHDLKCSIDLCKDLRLSHSTVVFQRNIRKEWPFGYFRV
ncbi:hypothetical protein FVE85_7677 [Porphyridium purpureum]|uniref:Uncharacterized protein n=1 Tax=Porphyridium purpureum TaxID=35688 RepID=A0A5J4ZAL5_PORPP|nr:hypothetical protein FVE85_7677 [Porphyridium purpureum]|eukprot:POR8485..scf295_1